MSQAKNQFLKTIKKAVPVLLICLALNGAMLGLLWTHYTGGLGQAGEALVMLENKLLDMRFVLRGKQKPSSKIGILALDERSIQKFGRWPFSRSVYEQAFLNLKKAGAEWIGLDLVWDQPQRPLLAEALPEIRQMASNPKIGTETLRLIEDMDNVGLADRAVVSAVKEYNKVVLGYMFYEPLERDNVKALSGREFAALSAMQESVINAAILPDGFELNKYPDLAIGALVGNTDFIAASSPNFGFFNNEPESDAVMRWVTMLRSAQNNLLPSMSLKMAAKITGRDIVAVFDRIGVEEIMLVNPDNDKDVIKIPVDPTGRGKVMLNHLGPSATIKRISLAEAYDGVFSDADAKTIKGMSFMMGPTAMAINDIRANPFDSTFNGVEHHATMIDNIISKTFLNNDKEAVDLIYLSGDHSRC
jgi:adenylate cyclase